MNLPAVGWIGTGVMGSSMCSHLLNAGYPVSLYNRTRSKADSLIKAGANWCNSPAEVAKKSTILVTMVGYPEDVRDVILGPSGLLAHAEAGTTLIDMSTSEPELAETIYRIASEKGIHTLDAPVSGGDTGAREGTLSIMAGGDEEVFQYMQPVLNLLGGNISYMGGPGSGQHTKMCNQILIAGTMIGVVESLLYAQKSGLDPEQVIGIIGKGAAACWSINTLGPRILRGDFNPGFYIRHFVKDMQIALNECRRMKLSLPGLAMAEQFYVSAMAQGYENLGTQGLYKVLENMNSRDSEIPDH